MRTHESSFQVRLFPTVGRERSSFTAGIGLVLTSIIMIWSSSLLQAGTTGCGKFAPLKFPLTEQIQNLSHCQNDIDGEEWVWWDYEKGPAEAHWLDAKKEKRLKGVLRPQFPLWSFWGLCWAHAALFSLLGTSSAPTMMHQPLISRI